MSLLGCKLNPASSPPSRPSQLLIDIAEVSSVITWDFDVCKGDVVFNIFHSKREPAPPRKEAPGAAPSVGGANLPLIDRNWTLGQDYSKVETALACREGESVQVRGTRGSSVVAAGGPSHAQ